MDKALKQRLVGASVLIAFAVIVLPMLLSGQPESQQESRRIELPPKPQELEIETRRFPIGEQEADQPSVLEPPPVRKAQQQPRSEPVPSAATPEARLPDEPVEPSGATAAEVAAETAQAGQAMAAQQPSPTGRYLVQVASFSGTGNANRLADSLREAGMPVLMDTVDTAAGRLHRVRIGPYEERADATLAIDALNARIPDLSPRVLDLRPEESAPVAEASDPLIRWVVQVGSFADSGNADSLVYRLRDAGYRASSQAVSDDAGLAFKVRVGPVVEREDAEQLAGSIKSDLGLDGLVMSAD